MKRIVSALTSLFMMCALCVNVNIINIMAKCRSVNMCYKNTFSEDIMIGADKSIQIWDWEKQNDEYNYKDTLKTVKSGGAVFFIWRCHSNQVKSGDRVFIIKLGTAPRGIFATGYASSETYEGKYTDDKGQDVHVRMIDICITGLIDYNTVEFILQDILNQKFPDQQWNPYGAWLHKVRRCTVAYRKLE